jgi:dihydrofolate synthase/folylpolyglutamate synthase
MNPPEIHAYLNSFVNFESLLHRLRPEDFYLERIEKFLDLAGHPARNLKIVHVAGTKGKGSTCAFLAGILRESGYKVGLYTSPHLHRVNERIRILTPENARSKDDFSGAISDEDLGDVLNYLRPFAAVIKNEGNILTYFEVLTVAALCYFAKSQVDAVILETGLGGRLDATNASGSAIAVLTPVSLDHTQILGTTLGQIASEKAGIIKSSQQKVVIAPQEKEAMDMILSRCKEFGVKPVIVDPAKHEKLKIGLKGRHQIENFATAVETAEILKTMGFKISDEAVEAGLKTVRWPGRFELMKKSPDVIVDCAHNEASARALSQTMQEEYPGRRVILVLGVSQDKDVAAICGHLKNLAAHVVLTKAGHPRSHVFTPAQSKVYFGRKPFDIIEDVPKAMEKALQISGPKDVVLVTGSIFVVAEAREFLMK